MKKTILIGLGIIAIALLVAGCTQQTTTGSSSQPPSQQPPGGQPPTQTPSTVQVTIKDFAFSPADLRIKQGDRVTWTNEDSVPHTVKFDFKES